MLINKQKSTISSKFRPYNSSLKTEKVFVEFMGKEKNDIELKAIQYFKYIKMFWILLKKRGIKYTTHKIKNKIRKINSSNNLLNESEKIFINKNENIIYNAKGINLDINEYIRIIKGKDIITKNPRLKILNDFLNIKKTVIHFNDRKDLLLFNDLEMISSMYEKLTIEDFDINIPIKI